VGAWWQYPNSLLLDFLKYISEIHGKYFLVISVNVGHRSRFAFEVVEEQGIILSIIATHPSLMFLENY
jgi:hypothetical protein